MINKIRRINNKTINKNKVYLYSAGFNIDESLNGIIRVDEEINDLKKLIFKKVKIVLISHQGSYKNKNTIHLDFLKKYLIKKLKTKIIFIKKKLHFFPKKLLNLIKPGEILFLPNTRFFKGEELNSNSLGKRLSNIADILIVGGFSKAHRHNSSNNAILKFMPAYLSNGMYKEIKKIKPWSNPKKKSLCVIGGEKKEKITIGLNYLSNNYDYIIPGGIVLNSILKSLDVNIGSSNFHGRKQIQLAKKIFFKFKKKILLPEKLIVSKKNNFKKKRTTDLRNISNNEIIVGFKLTQRMREILINCVSKNKHILLAGTPSLVKNKFNEPSAEILNFIKKNKKNSLLLGGDTVTELIYKGNKSSGGGSALHYLSNKSLPVIQGLYKNQLKFNVI